MTIETAVKLALFILVVIVVAAILIWALTSLLAHVPGLPSIVFTAIVIGGWLLALLVILHRVWPLVR